MSQLGYEIEQPPVFFQYSNVPGGSVTFVGTDSQSATAARRHCFPRIVSAFSIHHPLGVCARTCTCTGTGPWHRQQLHSGEHLLRS